MTVTLQKPRTHQPDEVGALSALAPRCKPLAPSRGLLNGVVLAVPLWVLILVVVLLVLLV
ncbi:MAG: hypothetical protein AVDCRST_MAG24-1785 [uncultured Nocardioidaceae bacterium]|uniref:Uncharacterized protein n=1 Tax=uncultured Nocardioidaceae bacterium TaxID=253824 RepID=A0A6J4M7D3_9ACTN|nr:MAG: hypothetical protein AVDCRST_MAG24-1785 [uncultured Nocardioidaceae bacterium]